MKKTEMTAMERVVTAIGHQEADRVPFFLLLTMHGAGFLDMSIREYFSKAENVARGQLFMRTRYGHDCIYAFFYAAIEIQAWGGEVIWSDIGPPNAGEPFLRNAENIRSLSPPKVRETDCLCRVLQAIAILKEQCGDEVPIIGVVMSPFSLPVMQMGFDRYIELIYEQPELFRHLMKINEAFCTDWANAQVAAGAAAICYFDPVSSASIIPPDMYAETGFEIAQRTLARIKAPTASHMASGRCLPIVSRIARTGTALVGGSSLEDLAELKKLCAGKTGLLGNLNGVEMQRWTRNDAETKVREAIAAAGPGGGFILSDNHGEIPLQVSDETLMHISEAVRTWGRYPLTWTKHHAP